MLLFLFLSAVSRDGTARLWDCGTARCLDKLTSIRQPINSCSLSASEVVAQRNPSPPLGRKNFEPVSLTYTRTHPHARMLREIPRHHLVGRTLSLSLSHIHTRMHPHTHTDPECGTNDKLLALACGDRYLRGVDVRSRKSVSHTSKPSVEPFSKDTPLK